MNEPSYEIEPEPGDTIISSSFPVIDPELDELWEAMVLP